MSLQWSAVVSPPAGGGDPYGVFARGAVVSADQRYRYRLWRRWSIGGTALFVMLNPSTADATADDPTISRCIGFARRFGCGALEVVNLFALRSTDPRVLLRDAHPVGPQCDDWIAALASHASVNIVVAAWGADPAVQLRAARLHIERRDHAVTRLLDQALAPRGMYLQRIGPPTKAGHPRHPLYLRYGTPLEVHP